MALLDAYGRPVRLQQLTQRLAEPGLTGVRQIWTGSVASGLTPRRLAEILRACDQGSIEDFVALAEEMEERDAHYFSVLGQRKRAVSGVTPTVTAASEDARDRRIADAVRERIAQHDGFPELVEDLLDALGKGFAVVNIEWVKTAALWWPRTFLRVDPRFCRFDDATGQQIRLRDEADLAEGVPLEPYCFITHRAGLKSGLAYRGGIARVVAFGWMCKAYALKDWIAFIETYGLPLRLGRYGPEATHADVQKLFSAVANIGTDAAAVLPKSMEIEFEGQTTGTGDRIFESLARYVDEQISKAVLGQTMTTDNGSSQSQANVHNEVRHDIAAADARALRATLARDLVKPFVDLNFGVQERYPVLSIEVAEPEDVGILVDKAVALMAQGMTFKAAELRAKLRLSDPEEGDEIVGGKPAAAPPGENAATNAVALNRAGIDAVDEIEAEMLGDWQEVMDETLAPLEDLVAGAESYEELMEQLEGAMPKLAASRAVEALVKGMFKARAVGDRHDG
ncbi:DUF935 domain-containing protein [Albidovulum sp.]|uniref:DUF935 domain-containing protein n=1 Tax=Albidovulum sp. TaxID=1872424 RepID=UPI0039B8D42A